MVMKVTKDKKPLIKLNKNIGKKMDELEKKMAESDELLVFPLTHRFTDGLYSREVSLGAGCLVTSKTHKVQHQFFLLKGSVLVWNNEGDAQYIQAPFVGITEVGTRRVVYAIEDSVWITCHPNPDNEVLDVLESRVFEEYNNNLLTDEMKNRIKKAQKKSNKLSNTINTNLLKHN
jgi:hypothetical protein